jgi:PAS domain S-box-containing protein
VNRFEEGNATYMNRQFEKIYGWPKEDLTSIDSFFENVYPDPVYRKSIRARIMEDISTGDPDRMFWENIEVTGKDGLRRIVSARNIPLIEQNIMISTVQDETPRIRAEQAHEKLREQYIQAQKMESVGRLAGGVAHDYNNMLSVILGNTEMAMEKVPVHDPLYFDLMEILRAARRSADITRQLLAFARKQTIDPKVIDLNVLIEGTLKMLRRLIGEDINLSFKPGRPIGPIKIDPAQVDHILANLCVNARDAIEGVGHIAIVTDAVTCGVDDRESYPGLTPGEYVCLSVGDDGCGMDLETLNNLFEPFFTTKGVDQGTGLGLATVYGIVKQNNGTISVDSEPGQGTTFRIYLPRHAGDALQKAPSGVEKTPASQGETVLLVEDEPAMMKMVQAMLTRLGYKVLAAGTPNRAIRLAEAHAGKIDLLITDVVMPEMNGRELAARLHACCPGVKSLFMSGYTADVIADRGILYEGMNFIQKPFSSHDLGAKIRTLLV